MAHHILHTHMNKRCSRCDIPHSEHPDANKTGGVGELLEWEDGLCGVCLDRKKWKEQQAKPYLIARKLREHHKTHSNAQLHEFLTA